jgi:hypothetical protein
VSQIGNLRTPENCGKSPTGSRQYSRLTTCATKHRDTTFSLRSVAQNRVTTPS